MNICIIDDDLIFHYICKVNFSTISKDHVLMTFTNGQQAYEYFQAHAVKGVFPLPDLLFVDINMPVMDGWELVDKLQDLVPLHKLDLYILSSSISPNDRTISLSKQHVRDFLTKPLQQEDFMRVYQNAKSRFINRQTDAGR